MADSDAAPPARLTSAERRRLMIRPLLIALLAVALNIAAYFLLPPHLVRRLGALGYLGVFAVTFIANATVVVPVPYFGLVARLAQELDFAGVVLAGALGSVLGESVAYFVGRSGRGAVEDTRFYRWVQVQMRHPWRAFALLFALSAPPNPAFDVAGLAAGALGLPYWLFFTAVFLGRIVRVGLIALLGSQID